MSLCLFAKLILPDPRSHRLIVRGAVFESIVPEAKTMTDEEAAAFLRLALTSEEARGYLKKRTEGGKSE